MIAASKRAEALEHQDFSRIHLFKVRSRKLCLDVNSARIVRLSDPAWDLLRAVRRHAESRERNVSDAINAAPADAIREVCNRIEAGSLFTPAERYESELHPLPVLDSAILNLTHRCNLACKYCFMEFPDVREYYGGSGTRMSEEIALRSIDFLHRHSRPGTSVTFFGGEPLLEFDLLKRAVTYAEEHYPGWFRFGIISNGTRMDDEIQSFLDRHDVGIIISLDGAKQTHDLLRTYAGGRGSHDDIMRNIPRLRERKPGFKTNITFTDATRDIVASYEELRTHGVPHLRFEKAVVPPADDLGLAKENVGQVQDLFAETAERYLGELLEGQEIRVDNFDDVIYRANAGEPRRRGCDLGLGYVAIAADGTVYPCHKFIGNPEHRLGTVATGFDRSMGEEIWHRPVETRSTCNRCWAKYYCGGYCVADNHLRSDGDFYEPDDDTCELIRTVIEQGLWLHEELRERNPEILAKQLGWKYVAKEHAPFNNPDASFVDSAPPVVEISGARFELSPLTVTILDLCDGETSLAGITDAVRQMYPDADPRLVEDDVSSVVTTLVTRGILLTEASVTEVARQNRLQTLTAARQDNELSEAGCQCGGQMREGCDGGR